MVAVGSVALACVEPASKPPPQSAPAAARAPLAAPPDRAPARRDEVPDSGSEPAPPAAASAGASAWVENAAAPAPAPEREAMPAELMRENVRTTAFTALVRVLAVRVDDPFPGDGYVNLVYRAEVIEAIRGELPSTLEYSVMAERSYRPWMPGYPILVSLCGSPPRALHVPDNGYVSAAPAGLVAVARRAARTLRDPPPTVCQ